LQGICHQSETGDLLSRIRGGSLKVALYKGEVGWEYAERELRGRNRKIVVLEYGHRMETMAMLITGVYNIVLMDSLSCAHFIKTSRTRRFKLAFNEPLEKYHACIALKKEYEYLLSFVDAALDKERNSPHFLRTETNSLIGYEDTVFKQGIHD
jgi:hypothetical protein